MGFEFKGKLTSSNFNKAFLCRNGDTDTTGRIKAKCFTVCKRPQDITGLTASTILVDTGAIELTGVGPFDITGWTFPPANVSPANMPDVATQAVPPEDGKQFTLVNNTDGPITFSVFNANKNYVLEKGCAMFMTYCASTSNFAPDGQGNNTPCLPIYEGDADYIANEQLKHGSVYCNENTKTIRVYNSTTMQWMDKRGQAVVPFYDDETDATTQLNPTEDDDGLLICDESTNTLKVWKWDSVSGTGSWIEKSQNPLKCCIEQIGHGFTFLQGVRPTNAGWVLGNASIGNLPSTHLVVEVIDADNFCVQAYGPCDFGLAGHGLPDDIGCFFFDDLTSAGDSTPVEPTGNGNWNNALFQIISPSKIEVSAGERPYMMGETQDECVPNSFKSINQSAHGFNQYDQIGHDGTSYVSANSSNSTATSFFHNIFTVVKVIDADNFLVSCGGIMTCPNSFDPNCTYYTTNDGSGGVTSSDPDTYYNSGDVVQPAFFVIDSNCLKLMNGLNNYIKP